MAYLPPTTPVAPFAISQSEPTPIPNTSASPPTPIAAPVLDVAKVTAPTPTVTSATTFVRTTSLVEGEVLLEDTASGTYLASLAPVWSAVGAYAPSVGRYNFTAPLVSWDPVAAGDSIVGWGNTYEKGIYAHAPSRITYQLEDSFQRMETTIFLWEAINCGDGAIFSIFLDDIEVFRSPTLTPLTEPQDIEVDVSAATTISLITEVGEAQNNHCDWAIWGDPILLKNNGGGVDEGLPVAEVAVPTATRSPTSTPAPPSSVPSPLAEDSTATPLRFVEGKVLFEDDFEAGYARNWENASPGFDVIRDEDGDWILGADGATWDTARARTPLWGDYEVELNVKVTQESEQHGSVSINIHDSDHIEYFYSRYEISLNIQGADIDREGDTEDACEFFTIEKNSTFGLDLNRWYSVRVEVKGTRIVVFVDGVSILSGEDTSDSPLLSGPIILMNAPESIVYYDDVRVVELLPAQATTDPSPTPSPTLTPVVAANTPGYVEGKVLFEDDFEAGYARGWSEFIGDFSVTRDDVNNLVLEANPTEWQAAIAGDVGWDDYAFDFKFRVVDSKIKYGWDFSVRDHLGEVGCEGYRVRVGPFSEGEAKLTKQGDVGCPESVLDKVDLVSLSPNTWYSIRSEAAGNNISIYLDGQLILRVEDNVAPLLDGAVRLSVYSDAHIQFDDVRVVELLPQ